MLDLILKQWTLPWNYRSNSEMIHLFLEKQILYWNIDDRSYSKTKIDRFAARMPEIFAISIKNGHQMTQAHRIMKYNT